VFVSDCTVCYPVLRDYFLHFISGRGVSTPETLCYYYYYFRPLHQHKATRLSENNDHDGVSHGVECIARRRPHSPFWRAIGKRRNRNTVSLVSSVSAVMRLPVSWISSTADWFQVPAVSTVTGKQMWEAESASYFTILFAAASFAAEHASLAVWSMCHSA